MCFIVELEVKDWPLGNEAPDLVGKDKDGEGLDYKALARLIFEEQLSQGWPGLAREVKMFADSRTMFRIRTKMLELIANMKPTCMERATLHVRLAVHGL